jgi:drug/metabolite transporter (DMT)-like permease
MSGARALALLHASVAMFGFAGLFAKWISLPPQAIVLGRTSVAAAVLFALLRLRGRPIARPDLGLAINGAILALHWWTFFAAIRVSDVATGLLGFASFPLFVRWLERALLRTPGNASDLSVTLLVVVGLALVVPEPSWSNRTVQGLALGVVSGFTFALLAVRNRARVERHGAIALALWQNAFAAVTIGLALLVTQAELPSPTMRDLALLIVLGAICTALAHTLFIASLAGVSAHTASVVAALEPVYGIALAAMLLGEVPAMRTMLGATLIIVAAIVATGRASRGAP